MTETQTSSVLGAMSFFRMQESLNVPLDGVHYTNWRGTVQDKLSEKSGEWDQAVPLFCVDSSDYSHYAVGGRSGPAHVET